MMWGRLVVTKDVDAYLEAHPEFTLTGAASRAMTISTRNRKKRRALRHAAEEALR